MEQMRKYIGIESSARRILVVEGEVVARKFAHRVLAEQGHTVRSVTSGAEAIGSCRLAMEQGRRYEAVILSLEGSGVIGGLEIFEQLRMIDPEVPAIVSSDDTEHPVMLNCRRYGFQNSLTRPYGEVELAAAMDGLW